ncbi:MAG TPA: L,D-transpeptidase family protein [Gaiellaceae bacterium]|nr:L,D-transpeptidase family protein [Gaiellaceae bacterium]
MARRRYLPLAVAAGLAAFPAPASATPRMVEVAFLREGRIVRVERVVPPGADRARHALRELVQGPTKAERAAGLRTAIRPGTRLRSVRLRGDTWVASFSRLLAGPATAATMERRLTQLRVTLAPLRAEPRFLALAVEGRLLTTLGLRAATPRWRAERGERGYPYAVRGVQLRLSRLGYLDRRDVTGELDYRTSQALLAFQGWEGLARTGTVTGDVQVELLRAAAPRGRPGRGRRVEIHRDRGVLLLLDGRRLVRAIHTSTGAGGATPAGTFRVYRKERLSWSRPFQVWMPFASYFRGGIAMHEYPDVPAYPASHGCVRLPAGEAERVYRFVAIGTPVHVR